jgi:hypothetical protein
MSDWPGDTRPLWQRALGHDKRQRRAELARQRRLKAYKASGGRPVDCCELCKRVVFRITEAGERLCIRHYIKRLSGDLDASA